MLSVLLLQLPVPNNPSANIPLAAGYLKAWAHEQGLLDRVMIEILPRDLADRAGDALLVREIVRRRPDVLGISLYTWNSERSLWLASIIKQQLPSVIVIVGGPEVQRNNAWVLQHPAVDVAVEGEGEQTFGAILERLVGGEQQAASSKQQAGIGNWESGIGNQELTYSNSEPIHVHVAVGAHGHAPLPHTVRHKKSTGRGGLLYSSDENFATIAGTITRRGAELVFAPPRVALAALDVVPSPYLLGYLEVRSGEIALIECSRWCPYGCTFCLYGRNAGTKLGGRLFGAARILAEVAWVRERGAGAIHFVEANLNLLPNFRELMRGLQQINAPNPTPIYAELRGEHLKDDVVDALLLAGLHTAEVGLQSANRAALQAVGRRTDLDAWAAGTRRLGARGVHVLLDVILGLPEDDRDSTLATVDWIAAQQLDSYDVFTLQVLPGTGIRNDAERFALRYQDRPPYYVLGTHKLSYAELRGLRWELREAAGLDPQAVEGLPQPSAAAWRKAADKKHKAETVATAEPPYKKAKRRRRKLVKCRGAALARGFACRSKSRCTALNTNCHQASANATPNSVTTHGWPIHTLVVDCAAAWSLDEWRQRGAALADAVASHVVVVAHYADLAVLEALCWPIAEANPTIHWDVILDDPTLAARNVRELGERWPHEIGYLDRVAVYRRSQPQPAWSKVSPRWWLVADWQDALDPLRFEGVAEIVWRVNGADIARALPTIEARGGAGLLIEGRLSNADRDQLCEREIRVLNAERLSDERLSDESRIV